MVRLPPPACRWFCWLLPCCLLVSCGTVPRSQPPPSPPPSPAPATGIEADRAAILRLAGHFRVDYTYTETQPLRPGYSPTPASAAAAREVVLVVEDRATRIVLQHLLLVGTPTLVVKHWREDWDYQPATLIEHVDRQAWQRRTVPAERRGGRWSRSVFEADGAPRHAALGRWTHGPDGSQFEVPSPVLSPKPRRELTRLDYELLWLQDRISVPAPPAVGWKRTQQITKTLYVPVQPPLVQETVEVRYTPEADAAGGDAAAAYWQRVGPYWTPARAAWAGRFPVSRVVRLRDVVDGTPRWRRLFTLIEAAAEADRDPADLRPQLRAVLRQVAAPDTR
jgi:hypothetical protein